MIRIQCFRASATLTLTFVFLRVEVISIQKLASQSRGKQLPNRAAPTR